MLRRDDRRRLQEAFHGVFDRSKAEQLMAMDLPLLNERLEVLGQGTHFRAWRFKTRKAGAPDLVLKRALPGWLNPPARRVWRTGLGILEAVAAKTEGLVPPFELLEDADGGMALVMPYGDAPFAAAAPHWLPLNDRLDELSGSLHARGFALLDKAQGRTWQGIPFLYDFSDLSMIKR